MRLRPSPPAPGRARRARPVRPAVGRGGASSTLPSMRILFWFRDDLRLADNTGLHEAARDAGGELIPFHTTESSAADRGRSDAGAPAQARFAQDSLAALAAALER